MTDNMLKTELLQVLQATTKRLIRVNSLDPFIYSGSCLLLVVVSGKEYWVRVTRGYSRGNYNEKR
jgi:hypothetical protein